MKLKFDRNKWEYWWQEWIKPVLIAVALAFFVRTFFVQPFKIPSNSMYPTLKPGDRIFVNKLLYGPRIPLTDIRIPGIRGPQLGDIVVFTSPVERKKYLVKRYIAGEGESVEIKEGELYVDGKKADANPFKNMFYYNRGEYGADNKVTNVPGGYFYVLGDNSANSMDSRYWGFVPYRNLVGRAFLIHWPIKRIRLIREGE
jgi:signal peptidase I